MAEAQWKLGQQWTSVVSMPPPPTGGGRIDHVEKILAKTHAEFLDKSVDGAGDSAPGETPR